jgi:hypothetical protein
MIALVSWSTSCRSTDERKNEQAEWWRLSNVRQAGRLGSLTWPRERCIHHETYQWSGTSGHAAKNNSTYISGYLEDSPTVYFIPYMPMMPLPHGAAPRPRYHWMKPPPDCLCPHVQQIQGGGDAEQMQLFIDVQPASGLCHTTVGRKTPENLSCGGSTR